MIMLAFILLFLYASSVWGQSLRSRHDVDKEKLALRNLESELNFDSNLMYTYADFTDTWAISNSNTYSWESCAVSGTGQYGIATTLDVAGVYISSNYLASWAATTTTFVRQEVSSSCLSYDGTYAIVSEYPGYIYYSTNYGASFTYTTQYYGSWVGVSCSTNGQIMVAAALDNYIYISYNHGTTLTYTQSPLYAAWTSVSMSSNSSYILATAESEAVYVSSNLGVTWSTPLTAAYYYKGSAVSSMGMYMYVVTEGNGVYISSNYGVSFSLTAPTLSSLSFTSVACSGDGSVVVICAPYNPIYISINYGKDFIASTSPSLDWTDITTTFSGTTIVSTAYGSGVYVGTLYYDPTVSPTLPPTQPPSQLPTLGPTQLPTLSPTLSPSELPTINPTASPTVLPTTTAPSAIPTAYPSSYPTSRPTPTPKPSRAPTPYPTPATYVTYTANITLYNVSSAGGVTVDDDGGGGVTLDSNTILALSATTAECSGLGVADIAYLMVTNVTIITTTTTMTTMRTATLNHAHTVERVHKHQRENSPRRLQSASPPPTFSPTPTPLQYYEMVAIFEFYISSTTPTQAEDYYTSYTNILLENIEAGVYSTVLYAQSISYNAPATIHTKALGVGFSEYEYVHPFDDDANSGGGGGGIYQANLLTMAIVLPSVLLFVVSVMVMSLRAPHLSSLNELNSLMGEMGDVVVRCVTISLSLSLTISYSQNIVSYSSAQFAAMLLMLVARGMVMFFWAMVMVFVLAASAGRKGGGSKAAGGREGSVSTLGSEPHANTQSESRGHGHTASFDTITTSPSLIMLLHPAAMTSKLEVTVYGVLVTLSLLDVSFTRYLPWIRTEDTSMYYGYPSVFMMRLCMYGMFITHFVQSLAVLVRVSSDGGRGGDSDGDGDALTHTQQQESYLLLAITLFNVLRGFVTLMLSMQIVVYQKDKLMVVSEGDMAALSRFVGAYGDNPLPPPPPASSSSPSSVGGGASPGGSVVAGRGRKKTLTLLPGRLSQMLFGKSGVVNGSSADAASVVDSQASTVNVADEDANRRIGGAGGRGGDLPLFIGGREGRWSSTEMSSISGIVGDDGQSYLDDRGIRFSTALPYADETVEVLRFQLQKAGKVPVSFMPLDALQSEIADIFQQANAGQTFDEARLDYLLMCLDCNPDYRLEKEQETLRWRSEHEEYLQECLDTMRSYIPPYIFHATHSHLVEVDHMHAGIAKRVLTKKCLWLVRLNKEDISKLHVAELSGRFNPEAQGLDIVETAAIFCALPTAFTIADGEGKKERWRAGVEQQVKDMLKQMKAGTLPSTKKRNPVYASQLGLYGQRSSLHTLSAGNTGIEKTDRQSWMLIGQMRKDRVAGGLGWGGMASGESSGPQDNGGEGGGIEMRDEFGGNNENCGAEAKQDGEGGVGGISRASLHTIRANKPPASHKTFLQSMLASVFSQRVDGAGGGQVVTENPLNTRNNSNNAAHQL